jgi:hypothetical protein
MIGAATAPRVEPHVGAVRVRVHGIEIAVRSDVPGVIETVARSYAAFLVEGDGRLAGDGAEWIVARRMTDGVELLHARGTRVVARDETGAILGTLDRVVMAVLGALGERGIVGTHAAAVAIDGRGIVMAGPSGAGKSTLTLALLRDGAQLLTDELTLIAADDRTVLPYPRAMHVSPATVDLLPELAFLHERPRQALGADSEWSVSTRDLERAFGATVAPPTPLAAIVLLDERGGPDDPPTMLDVSGAETAIALVRGTPAAARDFGGALARLGPIVSAVPTFRLQATGLARSAAVIRERLAAIP